MLHIAILTLALASGECPECDRNAYRVMPSPNGPYAAATPNNPYAAGMPRGTVLVPPPPLIKHPSIAHVIPCPVVRCVGQNCYSATRPYLPGVPVFDYRQDFNYPWSQSTTPNRPVAVSGGGWQVMQVPENIPTPAIVPGPSTVPMPEVLPRREVMPEYDIMQEEGVMPQPEMVPSPDAQARKKAKSRTTARATVRVAPRGKVVASRGGGVLVSDATGTVAKQR
jgi:hypothetical protein